MTSEIGFNKRSDFVFQNFADINIQRIVLLTLPFFSLYTKTAAAAAIGVGLYQCYTLYVDPSINTTVKGRWIQTALLVSSTALGFFFPAAQFALSSTVFVATQTFEAYQHLKTAHFVKGGLAALHIMHHFVHTASLYYGTPAWLVISLVSQACKELYQAYQFGKEQRRYPEMIAYFLLAALRLNKARTYLPLLSPTKETAQPPLTPRSKSKTTQKINLKTPTTNKISSSLPDNESTAQISLEKNPTAENSTEAFFSPAEGESTHVIREPHPTAETPLKQLTTDELRSFYYKHIWEHRMQRQSEAQLFDLHKALSQEGFSIDIQGVDFSDVLDLRGVFFRNFTFTDCDFSEVDFTNSTLENVTFENSIFEESNWTGSSLIHSIFRNCSLNLCSFKNTRIEATSFVDCDLSFSIFYQALLNQVLMERGKLEGSNFLFASVKESQLVESDLTNALLLETKNEFKIQGGVEHKITKPIVALGWSFRDTGPFTHLIYKALRDNDALVLLYEQGKEYIVNDQLSKEVAAGLQNIKSKKKNIAYQVLENAEPSSEIAKIKHIAASILKHCQGLVIPGGDDIETCFYKPAKKVECSERTVLELALLTHAQKHKIPTMGTCRGAQMINIFFGGTLLEDVSGQEDIHDLTWTPSSLGDELRTFVGNDFKSLSMHHQAIDEIGEGLDIVLRKGIIPKLLISQDQNFIASQIHPESYIAGKRILNDYKDFPPLMKKDKKLTHSETEDLAHYIDTNRNVYRFFLAQVEKARASSSLFPPQSSARAG